MRKVIAILLLFTMAASYTEIGQLCKIPFLLQHYFTHQKKAVQLDLVQFLAQHYGQATHNDNDTNEDNQLPFKSIAYPSSVNLLNSGSFIEFEKPVCFHFNLFPVYKIEDYSLGFNYTVFHPPRVAPFASC